MNDRTRVAAGLLAIAGVTLVYTRVLGVVNGTTAALTYLMVVLLVAATSRFWAAAVTSVAAVMCLNFFFLPPVGTFRIADPENWVALGAFLTVSLVSGNLASAARERAREALARQDALGRLFDISRDMLRLTDSREGLSPLVESLARRFGLPSAAVCLAQGASWTIIEAGPKPLRLDAAALSGALASDASLPGSPQLHTREERRSLLIEGRRVQVVPLRAGVHSIGLLVVGGLAAVEAPTLDALAGVVALAIERVQLLEARKSAELARQSEELKSALLTSIGHDLRTPLTAIRVAATNLRASLTANERTEQSDVVLAEVERLNRLFQNILDMARIDAGAVAPDVRRVHVSEVVEVARGMVSEALRGHPVSLRVSDEVISDLDPRLTAAALSHLLENAAQYSAEGAPIEVTASTMGDELTFSVRDRGPGIRDADLPHLFERFYRGEAVSRRPHGIGMGLAIARGLVAAEKGTILAENCSDGGARFTMVIPTDIKSQKTAEVTVI